jgi:methyl-accepting chemotaxis protein
MDWKLAWGLLKNRVYAKTGYPYVIDERGVLISHPKYKLNDGVSIADSKYGELADLVNRRMLKGERGQGKYTFEGVEKYVAFTPLNIGQKQYTVAVTAPTKELIELLARTQSG